MNDRKIVPNLNPESSASESLNETCGWCNQPSWFNRRAIQWVGYKFIDSGYGMTPKARLAGIYQCAGCENASLFIWWLPSSDADSLVLEHVWPTRRASEMDDLHSEVEMDRLEAWNSYLHGQHRASILMARSALQRGVRYLLREHDGALRKDDREPSLFSELDLLVDRRIITPQIRANVDEVRLAGNDVAHPEELGEISQQDAEDSLAFLDDFLQTTLAVPARQRKRQEDREAKKKGT